jgi:hypothetical protein
MKIVASAVALCLIAVGAGFALGRVTSDDGAAGSPREGPREYTLRVGDSLRVPSVAVYCGVDVEARRSRLHCGRLVRIPGFDVSFERRRTVVTRVGDPSQVTVFPEP